MTIDQDNAKYIMDKLKMYKEISEQQAVIINLLLNGLAEHKRRTRADSKTD